MPSRELLNWMQSGKVCITRGPSCNLDFGFSFKNLQADGASEKALVGELGQFVLGASWWAQLPVSPSLKSPTPSFPDPESEFSIEIHDTLPALHSNGYPGEDVSPDADLHIPECVPDIRLLGMKLFFTFEPIHDTPLPVLTKKGGAEDDMIFDDVYHSDEDSFESILDLDAFDSSTPRHGTSFDAGSSMEEMLWADDSVAKDQHSDYASDGMLLYQTNHNSIPLPTPEASTTSNSQQDTIMLDSTEHHFSNHLTTEPLLELATAKRFTDVALRTLLGGRQTRHMANIRIHKPRPTRPLSRIMPLIWSPGFKNNMSERCAFLTTISTALSSLSKASQLPSLQKKLATIHQNSLARSAETHPPRPNQSLQAHVFQMMQTALYEPIASRRLRPSVIEESGEEEPRSGPLSRDCENSGPPKVDLGNGSDDGADEEFENLFGEELLSDGEMDMLFDLEILRNREEGGSCSMLFGSGERDSSMLMEDGEVHEAATRESEEEDGIFSIGVEQGDGDEHILHERGFWGSSAVETEVDEDAEMIMETEPDTVHGYSSLYLDDPYINNEAIII
ncbi:hypothetical protein V494_02846 [Pseudogymnoascus sp. VKM F-4513 (FW-928)]|nr:hypothetical protein V494_02846 [Pseudogymnoascus sp. VKM F-4513 (FW-928)]